MFHSVRLFSQAPLARGSRALPSVLLLKGTVLYIIHELDRFCYMRNEIFNTDMEAYGRMFLLTQQFS